MLTCTLGFKHIQFALVWNELALRSSCQVRHFTQPRPAFVFLLSPHISLLCLTVQKATQGKHPIAKQACLVDMFVIQLMHYLEAAGCGTSIQLALSATVHQSSNYFWWFSSFNYCWTADGVDTVVVNGFVPLVVQASVSNGQISPTVRPLSAHRWLYGKRRPWCRNTEVLVIVKSIHSWKMNKLCCTQLPGM